MVDRHNANEHSKPSLSGTSLLYVLTVIARCRRLILWTGGVCALIALIAALLRPRVFTSRATFVPQSNDASASGLALAASQYGIKLPGTQGGGWGPSLYVELLSSPPLWRRLALDTIALVEEKEGLPQRLADLLDINPEAAPEVRAELTTRAIGKIFRVMEDKRIGVVRLSVTTKWPSVSLALTRRLVRGVVDFNNMSRKSQAGEERRFVEAQAARAEVALREAESAEREFLQNNRMYSTSARLTFEHDRLNREVALRQQLYTTLAQNREDARIREVRDIPVVSLIEEPQLAQLPDPRGAPLRAVLGGLIGAALAVLVVVFGDAANRRSMEPGSEADGFIATMRAATPRIVRDLVDRLLRLVARQNATADP